MKQSSSRAKTICPNTALTAPMLSIPSTLAAKNSCSTTPTPSP